MSRPGPKPKPASIKIATGNPGKRKIRTGPAFSASIMRAPTFLGDEGRKEWNRIFRELYSNGVVTNVDRAVLTLYCSSWESFVQAVELLQNESPVLTSDKGNQYLNPIVGIVNSARRDVLKYAVELGMTPSARTRISSNGQEHDELIDDLFNYRK